MQSLESYEEMGNTNTLQLPPKGAHNKPNTEAQEIDMGRYAQGGNSGANAAAQPHVQMRGQMRQQGYPRPPSDPPEAIYECPN